MIKFKVDIIEELKKAGYTTTLIRECGYISQGVLTKIKAEDTNISLNSINKICNLLECQPRDIIKYVETGEETEAIENIKNKKTITKKR